MKFFSIITICKDNLSELKKTHISISQQTSEDYEWIVIDGDSSDGTREWLKNIKTANWISEPDNGIYDAMNKGISFAKGKYLIFMNSGDCFDNNSVLSQCQKILEQHGSPAFVYGYYLNLILYFLHYIHAVIKKANPSIRFIKHKSVNQI